MDFFDAPKVKIDSPTDFMRIPRVGKIEAPQSASPFQDDPAEDYREGAMRRLKIIEAFTAAYPEEAKLIDWNETIIIEIDGRITLRKI